MSKKIKEKRPSKKAIKNGEIVDGLSAKNKDQIVRAIRQVWSWSTPRRLCIKRATKADGFPYCENKKCETFGRPVPKVFPDHIKPCGSLDAGYIERMFVPSKYLQALCGKCHGKKTREERAEQKLLRELLSGKTKILLSEKDFKTYVHNRNKTREAIKSMEGRKDCLEKKIEEKGGPRANGGYLQAELGAVKFALHLMEGHYKKIIDNAIELSEKASDKT